MTSIDRNRMSASPSTPAEVRSLMLLTKIPNDGEAVKNVVDGLTRDQDPASRAATPGGSVERSNRRGLLRWCVSRARQTRGSSRRSTG
jgi:hypothetical protein